MTSKGEERECVFFFSCSQEQGKGWEKRYDDGAFVDWKGEHIPGGEITPCRSDISSRLPRGLARVQRCGLFDPGVNVVRSSGETT